MPRTNARAYAPPLVPCLALALLLLGSSALSAQGLVRGTVRDVEGRALPLVYVMALPSPEGRLDPIAFALTDRNGSFVLPSLPEGAVWLRVRRVGWQLSDAVRAEIVNGDATVLDVMARSAPVALAELRVTAEAPCVRIDALGADSPILELFSTAADAVRARAAFARAYEFQLHRFVEELRANDSTWRVVEDTTVHLVPSREAPPPVSLNEGPARADPYLFGRHRRRILTPWRQSMTLTAPSDGILLSNAFRAGYCVLTTIERDASGDPLLRFRPATPDPSIVTALVKIRFDRVNARMLEVEYVYQFRERHTGTGVLEFTDVSVDGRNFTWFTRADFTVVNPRDPSEELLQKRFRFTPREFVRTEP